MAKNTNQTFHDSLTHALMQSFKGVASALDHVPAGRDTPSADTGVEKPSTKDISLQIEIGQILSYYDRQINGPIITKTGTYPCLKEMLLKNEKRIAEVRNALETGRDTDGQIITTTGELRLMEELEKQFNYLSINEAKLSHCTDMLNAYNTVWVSIFNRKWEPQKRPAPEAQSVLKDMTADEAKTAKAEALARAAAYFDNKKKVA